MAMTAYNHPENKGCLYFIYYFQPGITRKTKGASGKLANSTRLVRPHHACLLVRAEAFHATADLRELAFVATTQRPGSIVFKIKEVHLLELFAGGANVYQTRLGTFS